MGTPGGERHGRASAVLILGTYAAAMIQVALAAPF